MTLQYRPEIELLRAVAILFVIAAHLPLTNMSGGYVGVDVFFVISGFLIGRQVYMETRNGTFSFVAFYERRIRRIVPALYAMLAVLAVSAVFLLFPARLEQLGKSSLSVIVFSSNMFFWNEVGYFAPAAHETPLLHTWSLGVEEQLYLVFPLLLFLLVKWANRRLVAWLTVAAAASFAVNVWHVGDHPLGAFYLAPERAWEFLAGAILAVGGVKAPVRGAYRAAMVGAGLVLIVAPLFLYTDSTPFPGVGALPPVVGTALVIWGHSGAENQLLKWPVFKVGYFFGTISYSLYLWHWPLTVLFAKHAGISSASVHLNNAEKIALFAAMTMAGWLSFHFVERPIRNRAILKTRAGLFTATGMASACMAVLFVATVATGGFPTRVDPQVAALGKYLEYDHDAAYRARSCLLALDQRYVDIDSECLRSDPSSLNVLVWGDSLAAGYAIGFRAIAAELRWQILQATAESCSPVGPDSRFAPHCRNFNAGVQSFIKDKRPDALLLAGLWNFRDLPFLPDLLARVRHEGMPIFILGPPIRYQDRLPYLLVQFAMTGLGRFDSRDYLAAVSFEVDKQMKKEMLGNSNVTFISVLDAVCQGKSCPVLVDGTVPMQFDEYHLTAPGSGFVARKLAPFLAARLAGKPPTETQ
jgi:peptidoglycan/LPS O-acetylase OafA/YrhL